MIEIKAFYGDWKEATEEQGKVEKLFKRNEVMT